MVAMNFWHPHSDAMNFKQPHGGCQKFLENLSDKFLFVTPHQINSQILHFSKLFSKPKT
jgi:hypothetical protein